MDLAAVTDFFAQVSPTPAPAPASGQPAQQWLQLLLLAVGSPVAAMVSIYTLRSARRRDPLERRKVELEILEKERALGIAREEHDLSQIAAIEAEPLLEQRVTRQLILRFILLYLVLQVWGIVGGLFNFAGFGGPVFRLVAVIPQVVRAYIFVSLGWPLLLDTAAALDVKLPAFVQSTWTRGLLIAIAVLAAVSGIGFSRFFLL